MNEEVAWIGEFSLEDREEINAMLDRKHLLRSSMATRVPIAIYVLMTSC